MSLLNCTPHPINIMTEQGVKTLPKSATPARVTTSSEVVGSLNGIDVYQETLGEVYDLPAPEEGAYLLVSRMVAAACPNRIDLLVPGALVRDQDGRIVACKGLIAPNGVDFDLRADTPATPFG